MRSGKGRWPWTAAGAAVAGLALLLVVTAIPLGGGNGLQNSANAAQLTALLIAAATAAAGVMVWAQRTTRQVVSAPTTERLAQAEDVLAGLVAEQWDNESRLRSLDDPDPIPVRWRTPGQDSHGTALMDHPANIQADPGPLGGLWWAASSADIAALAELYRHTRRRRLVILGGPGTGKTTLALQLLLHLLATRTADEPVPVLLPAATWDTERYPRLQDWLADRLLRDYPAMSAAELGADVVRALTRRGRILPVLDGLDELAPAVQARMIGALNRSLGADDQLVLTCRTAEFTAAVAAAGTVVTSAVVLEPRPLTPAEAADHLTRCLPPDPGAVWRRVLTELRTLPPATDRPVGGPVAALAEVGSTPLGLWLVRTVYIDQRADPAPLLDPGCFPDAATLRAYLFDQIIPALLAARPPSRALGEPFRPRRAYRPADVQRWLTHLAHHLGHLGTRDFAWWHLARDTLRPRTLGLMVGSAYGLAAGLSTAVGLVPQPGGEGGLGLSIAADVLGGAMFGLPIGFGVGLAVRLASGKWLIPNRTRPRVIGRIEDLARRVVLGLITGLPFAMPYEVAALNAPPGHGIGPLFGLVFGLLGGLAGALTSGNWLGHDPVHADLRLRGRVGLLARRLAAGLTGGLGLGLLLGLALAYTSVSQDAEILTRALGRLGLPLGLAAGLVFGLIWWARTPALSDGSTTPGATWRSDRRLALLRIAAFGGAWLLVATPGGYTSQSAVTVLSNLPSDLLEFGILYGIMVGGTNAWICYMVANLRLAISGRTPYRMIGFLEDAHRLGLLRATGPVYQFRHAELQDHLAVHRSSA